MDKYRSNTPLRLFYVFMASMIWLGIWQTGFAESSLFFYIPGVTLIFATITGFCPSLIAIRKVMDR